MASFEALTKHKKWMQTCPITMIFKKKNNNNKKQKQT